MSRDEIIAIGNEAALQHGHTYEPEPGDGTIEFLGSFAALVAEKAAAKEREACAQVCEGFKQGNSATYIDDDWADMCAAAIRG